MANDKILSGIRLQLWSKTTTEWEAITAVPLKGEPCIEFDVDNAMTKLKFGDGVHKFDELEYVTPDLADYITKAFLTQELAKYAQKNEIPTKTSELANDSNFATEQLVKDEIAQLGKIFKFKGVVELPSELPTDNQIVGDFWLVKLEGQANTYQAYIWISAEEEWAVIGVVHTDVDLSEYLKKEDADSLYISKSDDTVLRSTDSIILVCGL